MKHCEKITDNCYRYYESGMFSREDVGVISYDYYECEYVPHFYNNGYDVLVSYYKNGKLVHCEWN